MSQNVDPDFAARVAEYQRKAKKGIAFQAEGTLGGRRMRPARPAWRARPMRSLFRLFSILLIVKVLTFHAAATVGFQANSQLLMDSDAIWRRIVVTVLYPDPISLQVSRVLTVGQLFFATELRKIL